MSVTSSISSARPAVEDSPEKACVTLDDLVGWGAGNAKWGIEVAGMGRCAAKSITTRFGAWRKAVRR